MLFHIKKKRGMQRHGRTLNEDYEVEKSMQKCIIYYPKYMM